MKSPGRSSRPRRGASSRTPDYRALAEFRHHLRAFLVFSEEKARAAGIEPQQHQLLLALKGLPEGERPTVGALAARLEVRHHTIVGLLDRLAERGLIVRRKSPTDAREILVSTTLAGERILRRLSRVHQEELQMAGPALVAALKDILGPHRAGRSGDGPA